MKYEHQHMYEQCKNHMHAYVLIEMHDGSKVDGIITGLDQEYVYVAVPNGPDYASSGSHHRANEQRQFGYGPYGYPGYGYGYPGYGYGYYPGRFRRLILPLAALAALSVLPWY